MMSEAEWQQLESNPDVMNNLLTFLGVSTKWRIFDILSLDEEFLDTISQPVLGVILLFPYTKIYKKYRAELMETLKTTKQNVDSEVFFMHQTVRNACGTVALLHAIANNMEQLKFTPESVALEFIKKSMALDPEEKARMFENDAGIKKAHEAAANVCMNHNDAPNLDDLSSPEEDDDSQASSRKISDQNNHYLTLIIINSKLYELDGYKDIPVCHGDTTKETFLKDAARICREYMERDSDSLNFSVLAFGETETTACV